jgi:hypothetical protein
MSAGVAGTTPFRPNPSYTTLRDVTLSHPTITSEQDGDLLPLLK